MRTYTHELVVNRSSRRAALLTTINDRFGSRTITESTVTGWRCDIAAQHLAFKTSDWNDDAARKFVGLRVLKCSKNPNEAVAFLDVLRSLSPMEVHFWTYKFLSHDRAPRAWRSFYAGRTP